MCPEAPLQEPTQNPACESIASYGSDSDSESEDEESTVICKYRTCGTNILIRSYRAKS